MGGDPRARRDLIAGLGHVFGKAPEEAISQDDSFDKQWDAMTPAEKAAYRAALLADAMPAGEPTDPRSDEPAA